MRSKTCRFHVDPIDLLEVYVDSESRLCDSVIRRGGKVMRFTQQDGNLSTLEGKRKLLNMIQCYRPKHGWMSPECKPFCRWNLFNQMRSPKIYDKIAGDQEEAATHLALCNTVCKIQVAEGRHFHFEQPHGASVWHRKEISEMLELTYMTIFDQCESGLKHPQTKEAMRKRTRVQTTSITLYSAMHGDVCSGNYRHVSIEGCCTVKGRLMSTSRFAVFYPREFARKFALALIKEIEVRNTVEALPAVENNEPPAKWQKTIETKPDQVVEMTEPHAYEAWSDAVTEIRKNLPKAGQRQWSGAENSLCRKVQDLCPEMTVKLIVACKGAEKYLVIDRQLPLRRTIVLGRLNNKIFDLGQEAWLEKPKSKQKRKVHPAHVMVCIFGNPPHHVENIHREATDSPEVPQLEPEAAPQTVEPEPAGWIPMLTISHGPKFRSLDEHRQGVIRKMHINLGHPAPIPFANHLRLAGAAPELVEAAQDFVCPSCAERVPPKQSTPGQLREASDFNDRIMIDGFDWKASNGERYYVTHAMDEATHFHLGKRTHRDTGATIKFLEETWTTWAGNPREILHDSAGEWITDEWKEFLMKEGIAPVLTAAPWQRGRVERHGSLVKETLSRLDAEKNIENEKIFDEALKQAFRAKNSLISKNGYSPEQAVLGKSAKLPGAISEDENLSPHYSAENGEPETNQFLKHLDLRTRARQAFLKADNEAAIRRSLLRKSRGQSQTWRCGQLCMYWNKRKAPNILERGRWCGPARVILHESRTIVWVSHLNNLLRCAQENLRPISYREFSRSQFNTPSEDTTRLQ